MNGRVHKSVSVGPFIPAKWSGERIQSTICNAHMYMNCIEVWRNQPETEGNGNEKKLEKTRGLRYESIDYRIYLTSENVFTS